MVFFISWLICAGVVGFIASNRGKSGMLWFFVSLLLSPLIGLVLVLCLKPNSPELAAASTEKMVRCPFCGESILAIAIKCKHCQSAVVPTVTDLPSADKADLIPDDACFFVRPESMSLGEYYDEIIARNQVKRVGNKFEWSGATYDSFSDLTKAIGDKYAG